ncbi:Fcf1-domain-containing protein [Clohesyomyces aquaticus]|uniref:U three protein 23 n=1 Tax=Clohesyomyces aquaticus TaxID=1231657 RepID=A0A1Y1ZHG9_9PLEO|nr:Fcf1-domain-containing protein [Clohesyomyces aquaticus]
MKLKRGKAYRKLMNQYQVTFNFREPYQVLVDSQFVQDAARFKMDMVHLLKRTVQGEIKPMITQCDMRHLYNAEDKDEQLILQAKTYERRRCNHHELGEPLSSLECLSAVVGNTNKNRYVIASQDPKVREHMRTIPGVPLVYINKSVMIMEPMAASTHQHRDRDERAKFKAGLKGRRLAAQPNQKRKRDDEEGDSAKGHNEDSIVEGASRDARPQKKHKKGPKGPNPLSIKKPKKREASSAAAHGDCYKPDTNPEVAQEGGDSGKRKRRRKHKPKGEGGESRPTAEGEPDSS